MILFRHIIDALYEQSKILGYIEIFIYVPFFAVPFTYHLLQDDRNLNIGIFTCCTVIRVIYCIKELGMSISVLKLKHTFYNNYEMRKKVKQVFLPSIWACL